MEFLRSFRRQVSAQESTDFLWLGGEYDRQLLDDVTAARQARLQAFQIRRQMEAAVVAQAKQPAPELPDSLKAAVSKLLSIGTTLEGGLQSVIEATGQSDVWMEIELLEEHHRNWTAHLTSLPDALRATPIPEESRVLMTQLFEAMAQRINHLHGQIAEKRGR